MYIYQKFKTVKDLYVAKIIVKPKNFTTKIYQVLVVSLKHYIIVVMWDSTMRTYQWTKCAIPLCILLSNTFNSYSKIFVFATKIHLFVFLWIKYRTVIILLFSRAEYWMRSENLYCVARLCLYNQHCYDYIPMPLTLSALGFLLRTNFSVKLLKIKV